MANPNFNAVLSTTMQKYRTQLEDNIFSHRPLVAWLNRKGQIDKHGGGERIIVPILSAVNTTAASYSGYDTIATTAQTGITAAEYPWKQYAVTVAINGLEEAQNSGESRVIDLLKAKVFQAEETISENWSAMFFADGTGNGAKDWLGLFALVGDATTSPTLVGGIDAATDATWRSYLNATAEVLSLSRMREAYNTTARGNDTVDFILTTQTLFEKYEGLLQPQERFTDSKTADGGFQNLLFKTAPVMFDAANQSGRMYFLNSKYLKLMGHSDVWFKTTPFVRPNNVDARYSQILCYGNFTVSNRKRQGVLTAKTA